MQLASTIVLRRKSCILPHTWTKFRHFVLYHIFAGDVHRQHWRSFLHFQKVFDKTLLRLLKVKFLGLVELSIRNNGAYSQPISFDALMVAWWMFATTSGSQCRPQSLYVQRNTFCCVRVAESGYWQHTVWMNDKNSTSKKSAHQRNLLNLLRSRKNAVEAKGGRATAGHWTKRLQVFLWWSESCVCSKVWF